jgi:hypothetical protein
MVYPSGLAFLPRSDPVAPPAPATFSMTMVWPRRFDITSAMIRDETSDAPPGANGTMSVMLRSGQVWAQAEAAARIAAMKADASVAMACRA